MELENEPDVPVPETGQCFAGKFIYPFAGQQNRAGIGFVERSQNMQQGGFPGTGGAYNGYDLSVGNRKINPSENLKRAVGLGYM